MFVHLVFKKIFQSDLSSSCCCTAVVTDTLICISCMYICILCIWMDNLYVYVLYTYTHIRSNRILQLDQVQYYICITLHLIDLYCAIRIAHTHTHTHTYIYIHIYIYLCVCVKHCTCSSSNMQFDQRTRPPPGVGVLWWKCHSGNTLNSSVKYILYTVIETLATPSMHIFETNTSG